MMKHTNSLSRTCWLPVLLFLCACGLGPLDVESGGNDNLPRLGAGPYTSANDDFDTPAEEPYLAVERFVSLLDPAAIPDDQGGLRVFFSRHTEEQTHIAMVQLATTSERPQAPPAPVLTADQAWEEGRVSSPAVVADGNTLYLYYQGGVSNPAIGLAVSSDGGISFRKHDSNPIVAASLDPFVLRHKQRWLMVSTNLQQTAIEFRESTDGETFAGLRELQLDHPNIESPIDSMGVRSPALVLRNPVGTLHYGLFYTGLQLDEEGEIIENIGYQGSYDAKQWESAFAGQPVLQVSGGAGGPYPMVLGNKRHLLYHLRKVELGRIAVATD